MEETGEPSDGPGAEMGLDFGGKARRKNVH